MLLSNSSRRPAIASAPEIRFQSMEVRIILGGVSYKYWYRDGILDANLVLFAGGTGTTGTAGSGLEL